MLLTKHEGITFTNQTIYISGQAFVRCNFVGCTLVLRESIYYLEGCAFDRCNWHVDWILMWGNPDSLREIKGLITLIENTHSQLPSGDAMQTPTAAGNSASPITQNATSAVD